MARIFSRWMQRFRTGLRDRVGQDVYLSEDGERIGTVKALNRDATGAIVSYIVDCDGTSVEVPSAHLIFHEKGAIIEPLWYIEAERFIHELEIETRKIPDADIVMASAERSGISRSAVLQMMAARKDIAPLVEKGAVVQKALLDRLQMLEEERGKVTQDIITLEQKRIFDEIDRREFITGLIDLRKRRVLNEASLEKCRSLLSRLNRLPFIPSEVDLDLVSVRMGVPGYDRMMREGQRGGMDMNVDEKDDRVKKVRKVRVLKVEKELEDLKERLGRGMDAVDRSMEERLRLTIRVELKKEQLKEMNEELRAIDKVLGAGDVTGSVREYFAWKKSNIESTKKRLSAEIKTDNKRIDELSEPSATSGSPEKGGPTGEKTMRDGGQADPGTSRRGMPCIICGDMVGAGLERCPSCGARTLPGTGSAGPTRVLTHERMGILFMLVGAGITLSALVVYVLL